MPLAVYDVGFERRSVCGLAFSLAYLPVLLYSLFVWWLDRYEKEPKRLIFAALFWGMLPAVVLAVLAEVALEPPIEEGLFCEWIPVTFARK
ncbi:MAG: hypothetical protein ACK4OK_00415 [Thermoflexus sp.]